MDIYQQLVVALNDNRFPAFFSLIQRIQNNMELEEKRSKIYNHSYNKADFAEGIKQKQFIKYFGNQDEVNYNINNSFLYQGHSGLCSVKLLLICGLLFPYL